MPPPALISAAASTSSPSGEGDVVRIDAKDGELTFEKAPERVAEAA